MYIGIVVTAPPPKKNWGESSIAEILDFAPRPNDTDVTNDIMQLPMVEDDED